MESVCGRRHHDQQKQKTNHEKLDNHFVIVERIAQQDRKPNQQHTGQQQSIERHTTSSGLFVFGQNYLHDPQRFHRQKQLFATIDFLEQRPFGDQQKSKKRP